MGFPFNGFRPILAKSVMVRPFAMSVEGHKRTSQGLVVTSALSPKADITGREREVR